MRTKLFFLMAAFASLALINTEKAVGQTWLTAGNTLAGGEKLGSLNNQPVNIVTNNLSRIFISGAGKAGFGTTVPVGLLTVKGPGSAPAGSWGGGNSVFTGFGEATTGSADLMLSLASDLSGARPLFLGKRARGTLAAPTAPLVNDYLSSFIGCGYDGTTFQLPASVDFFVDGAPSAGNVPARIAFSTGSNGSNRLQRLKIGSTGDFTFNNTQLFLEQSSGALSMGSVTPNASSLLDLKSTVKGVLFPRMTQAQRDAIGSPATGLLIYQTNGTAGFYYYNGGWQSIASSFSSGANNALSNLTAPTAVNTHLLPGTTAATDLGSASKEWRNLYLSGDVYVGSSRFLSDKGTGNNFFGTNAGAVSAGFYNTATGTEALFSNTNGNSNTANGYQALYTNTGTYGSAFGYQALFNNTSGYANNASGAFALNTNNTGSFNTALGADALINNTTGSNNTAVGLDALRNIDATSSNTGIGYYSGTSTFSVTQGTFLGANTSGGTGLSNVTAVGYGAVATASNQIMLGNSSVTSVMAAGSYVIYSDGRFKKDIKQDVPGLDFINKLRPVTYHYNIHDLNTYMEPSSVAGTKGVFDGKESFASRTQKGEETNRINEQAIIQKEKKLYTGFVAQEVEEAAKKLNYDFSGVYKPSNDKDVYGLSYSDFVVPLVKAVQELSKKNEELDKKTEQIDLLQKEVSELKEMVTKLLDTRTSTSAQLTNITLDQNNPNPFGNTTRINYSIPSGIKKAQLVITDISGKTIKQIPLPVAANATLILDASTYNIGTFTYTIIADGKTIQSKKMIVVR